MQLFYRRQFEGGSTRVRIDVQNPAGQRSWVDNIPSPNSIREKVQALEKLGIFCDYQSYGWMATGLGS